MFFNTAERWSVLGRSSAREKMFFNTAEPVDVVKQPEQSGGQLAQGRWPLLLGQAGFHLSEAGFVVGFEPRQLGA